jgi:hypothetical protein
MHHVVFKINLHSMLILLWKSPLTMVNMAMEIQTQQHIQKVALNNIDGVVL